MRIAQFRCRNFRNYSECRVDLDDGINVFLGQNAQGKTNLLEGLFFLSTTRSHRIHEDALMIKEDEAFSNLECLVRDGSDLKISAVIHEKGKTLMINRSACKKSSEFVGLLNVILFSPTDLNLFDESPRSRRKCMDIEIGKVSKIYTRYLSDAMHLLKERNSALKRPNLDEAFLDVLDMQLIEQEVEIIRLRKEFIDLLNEHLSDYFMQLSSDVKPISIRYVPLVEIDEHDKMVASLKEKMLKNRQRDQILQMTSIGVHRDDFCFMMGDHPVSSIASQGQRRMILLAMKLSLIEYVVNKTGKLPVLLLDDVLSELDSEKRINLFRCLPKSCQTIITTTDLDDCKDLDRKVTVYYVENGTVRKKGD